MHFGGHTPIDTCIRTDIEETLLVKYRMLFFVPIVLITFHDIERAHGSPSDGAAHVRPQLFQPPAGICQYAAPTCSNITSGLKSGAVIGGGGVHGGGESLAANAQVFPKVYPDRASYTKRCPL